MTLWTAWPLHAPPHAPLPGQALPAIGPTLYAAWLPRRAARGRLGASQRPVRSPATGIFCHNTQARTSDNYRRSKLVLRGQTPPVTTEGAARSLGPLATGHVASWRSHPVALHTPALPRHTSRPQTARARSSRPRLTPDSAGPFHPGHGATLCGLASTSAAVNLVCAAVPPPLVLRPARRWPTAAHEPRRTPGDAASVAMRTGASPSVGQVQQAPLSRV